MYLTDGQAFIFLQYLLCGLSIGILYTIALILRLLFGTKIIGKIIDLSFGLSVCLDIIIYAEIINNFELRLYCLLAIISGFVIYYITVLRLLSGMLKLIDKKFTAYRQKKQSLKDNPKNKTGDNSF